MGAKTSKRLAFLILVVGILGGGAYFARMFQVSRMAQSIVARAEEADRAGDYIKAVDLYRQHLSVVPNDDEVMIKYADALLKAEDTSANQDDAMGIYAGVLENLPNRSDIRRKLAVMEVGKQDFERGRRNLEILLQATPDEKKTPDDGELEFLLGQCDEDLGNDKGAEKAYRAANKYAPKLTEAYARLARLLRDRLEQPQEADQVIDQMVKANPDDYRVFLARGRYRRSFDPANADVDFRSALQKKPTDPDIYVELARSAEQQAKFSEARKILEDGLKKAGDSVGLYLELIKLGQVSNNLDQAIADSRRGIKALPDRLELRLSLAMMLVQKGDNEGLLEQIEEMKRRNVRPVLADFLMAHHYVMTRRWSQASRLLASIQDKFDKSPAWKSQINQLMAICHRELGDAESQETDLLRAIASNPNNVQARLELIQKLESRGEIDKAIDEYKDLIKIEPAVWSSLARLLIYRAGYLPAADKSWTEIEALIDQAEKANPKSADPSIMRAELLLTQGKIREAQVLLDNARRKFPKSLSAWLSFISLTAFQLNQPAEGLKLLDQAKTELGDRIELRVEQARIQSKQGKKGSESLGKSIEALSENVGSFSVVDQRKLLEALANEALLAECSDVATRLYTRCIENEPSNLMIRWKLLTLAFQRNDEKEIEVQINEIKRIEGSEPLMGTYADWWRLAWQAERPGLSPEASRQKRLDARGVLAELNSRRPDWSIIPLAYATLEEQELKHLKEQADVAGQSQVRESLINHYIQAINGGQHELSVVRRAIQLLFELSRFDAADQILRKLAPASLRGLAPDLRRMSALAARSQDFEGALEIARKAKAAKPEDFQERIWLAEILRLSGNLAEAESELRQAVKLAGGLADPWVVLIQFLTRTNQLDKANAALQEAKGALPKNQVALALAQGQDVLAQAYAAKGNSDEAKTRKADARKWYLLAESEQPDDPRVRRLVASFFLKGGQVAEVQTRLRTILNNPDQQEVAEVAWARRTLALTMLTARDKEQSRQALELFKDRDKTVLSPEDRRVLIQLLLAQNDRSLLAKAIEESQNLVEKKEATAEDRMLLAQLYRQNGEWPKARKEYRDLLDLQPGNKTCLSRYASELIARVKSGSTEDVNEAEQIIAKFKQLDPEGVNSLAMEIELLKAQGKIEQADALIKTAAERPNAQLATLGLLSEKLGRVDVAEQLLRRWESQVKAKTPKATLDLATFLGRNGRISEALDLCEKALASGLDPQDVARAGLSTLYAAKKDPAESLKQSTRVAELIEKAIKIKPDSPMLVVALGNVREQQERYEDAKALYRQGIKLGSKDGIPLNNLAWLTALQGDEGKTALDLINRAIEISGPIPDFLDTRGVAYVVAGESKLAIDDLEKAVAADSSPSKLVHLAQAWSKAGDQEKAKQYLDMAKIKGLDLKNLHPLEITAYRQLLDELAKK